MENGGGRSGVRFLGTHSLRTHWRRGLMNFCRVTSDCVDTLATCPGTIDNDFRRKSSSSVRGVAPAEGFDRALLSVDDGESACNKVLVARSYNIPPSNQRDHPSLLALPRSFTDNPTCPNTLHGSKLEFATALLQASAKRHGLSPQFPLPTGLLALGYAS